MVTDTKPLMTDIEALVYNWLERRKIEFEFQSWLSGGFYELGGMVVDFRLPYRGLAFRCMGEYWHRGVEVEGRDLIQREQLAALGYTTVNLWGEDIKNKLNETMTKALLGQEMLR